MSDTPQLFRRQGPIVTLAEADLAALLPAAESSPLRRSRICLHANDDDPLHEMVVCLLRDSLIRPHRHAGKSESYGILSGSMRLVLFDDTGAVQRVITLEEKENASAYFCRIAPLTWHTVLVDSNHVLFHETTTGPFRRDLTEYSPWLAGESDDDVRRYLTELREQLAAPEHSQ